MMVLGMMVQGWASYPLYAAHRAITKIKTLYFCAECQKIGVHGATCKGEDRSLYQKEMNIQLWVEL